MKASRLLHFVALLVVSVALLFFPFISAKAISFSELNKDLTIVSNTSVFRLRQNSSNWQLSAFSQGDIISSANVNGQLFVATSDGSLFVTSDGLKFSQLNAPKLSGPTIVAKGNSAVVVGKDASNNSSSTMVDKDLNVSILANSPSDIVTSSANIIGQDDKMVFFSTDGAVYQLLNASWQNIGALPCSNFSAFTVPAVGIACPNQAYQLTDSNSWSPLFSEPVTNISLGSQIVAISQANPYLIYSYDGQSTNSYDFTGNIGAPVVGLQIVGDRIFVRSDKLYELNNGALLTVVNDPSSSLLMEQNGAGVYIMSGSNIYYSAAPNLYQPTTGLIQNFNSAGNFSGNHIVWQVGSSNTAVATNSLVFHPMTSSWASSSKLIQLDGYNGQLYAVLYNSSNNLNLYNSSDFTKWSRITLPSQVTFTPTIAGARQLPVNSLVEISGVITTLPNQVVGSVIYLQDATGGIQIYLSPSKGIFPSAVGYQATVDGQVSSSSSKRVLLNSLADLDLLPDTGIISFPPVTSDQALQFSGSTAMLSGTVSDVSTDYFSLSTSTSLPLRVHMPSKPTQKTGDIISVPVVVDYNSSTGSVETWAIGDVVMVSSAPVALVTTDDSSSAPASSVEPVVADSAPTQPTSVTETVATSVDTPPSLTSPSTHSNASVLAAANNGANSNNTRENALLGFGSFVAGMITIRGRRFRSLA